MTEGIPTTLAQLQQLNRSLTERVLDKAASDPQWKQQLVEDSEAAMREANFPEVRQLRQAQASAARAGQQGQVRGQVSDTYGFQVPSWQPVVARWECRIWTWSWEPIGGYGDEVIH
jgi:hypothetical protein